MTQAALFPDYRPQTIVNVATVPLRSPFRYPGGKTWLVPALRQWLRSRPRSISEFVEPFAGGGIASLTVAFEGLAEHVTMVELDEDVAPVWQTVLGGGADWLVNRIATFSLSKEAVEHLLSQPAATTQERAFRTIVRNRVNRGGILAPGAGVVKHGENGKGLASRWYPETLCRRIQAIARISSHIDFIAGDGISVMEAKAHLPEAVFFIDPPYTVAGRRLYQHNEVDHEQLFRVAAQLRGDFLMTYDDASAIRVQAKMHGFAVGEMLMKTTHHSRKAELLIGRALDWLTQPPGAPR